MKRSIKTLVSAVAGLGFLTAMAVDASACGGRGGGGWGGGYRQSYNYQPNYYPQYPQQQFPQQQFQQVPQQQFSQQQVPQQQFQQQQFPQQQGQQVPQQQFSQQAVPQGQGAVAQNTVAAPQARVVAKPVSTNGANVTAVPAQPGQGSAEMSALQALSGWDGGEVATPGDAEATAQATFNPAGDFVATLANGATIRLHMADDSTFTWMATNKGKNSSFQGTYAMEGGALKLLRSSDNQKLEGTFGQTANGFSFKLGSGQTETNMSFVRN